MRVVSIEPVKPPVTLELEWEEAGKLKDILGQISRKDYANLLYASTMPEGYAEFMDSIFDALNAHLNA